MRKLFFNFFFSSIFGESNIAFKIVYGFWKIWEKCEKKKVKIILERFERLRFKVFFNKYVVLRFMTVVFLS